MWGRVEDSEPISSCPRIQGTLLQTLAFEMHSTEQDSREMWMKQCALVFCLAKNTLFHDDKWQCERVGTCAFVCTWHVLFWAQQAFRTEHSAAQCSVLDSQFSSCQHPNCTFFMPEEFLHVFCSHSCPKQRKCLLFFHTGWQLSVLQLPVSQNTDQIAQKCGCRKNVGTCIAFLRWDAHLLKLWLQNMPRIFQNPHFAHFQCIGTAVRGGMMIVPNWTKQGNNHWIQRTNWLHLSLSQLQPSSQLCQPTCCFHSQWVQQELEFVFLRLSSSDQITISKFPLLIAILD